MGEKTRFFGQAGLGFSYDAFRVENHIQDPKQRYAYSAPVKPQLITYLDAGVEIFDRFAFQIELPVIVYCSDGARSLDAVRFFRERGMEETWALAGGLAAWTAAGGPVDGER